MMYGRRLGLSMGMILVCGCQIEVEPDPPHDAGSRGGEFEPAEPPVGSWSPAFPAEDGSSAGWPPANGPVRPSPPQPRPVDPYRELVVVDPSVVRSPYASNASSGAPLGLRAQMAWLSGAPDDGLAFMLRWLDGWASVTSAGEYLAPVTPRPRVREAVLEPWLGGRARDDYALDVDTAWSSAPFALIAIVNRVDLAITGGHAPEPTTLACSATGGELRFVYAGLDPQRGTPAPMTIIVELPYSEKLPTASWARAFHDVAALPPGDDYNRALGEFVNRVRAAADPRGARVRTNEEAFGTPGELREFAVSKEASGEAKELFLQPLEFTPRADVDPKRIDAHVASRSDELALGPVPLPQELRAGAAQIPAPGFRWTSTALREPLMASFSRETCNGCHGGDTEALPFQHIALDATGTFPARLSQFLDDPRSSSDELGRRTIVMERLLASTCAPE